MHWKRYCFAPDMSVFSGGTHTPFPHVENRSVRTGVGLGFLLQPERPVQFAPQDRCVRPPPRGLGYEECLCPVSDPVAHTGGGSRHDWF